jgi:hypothetical protein
MADLQFVVDIQGKPHHRPRRTLQPTDHNTARSHTGDTGTLRPKCRFPRGNQRDEE